MASASGEQTGRIVLEFAEAIGVGGEDVQPKVIDLGAKGLIIQLAVDTVLMAVTVLQLFVGEDRVPYQGLQLVRDLPRVNFGVFDLPTNILLFVGEERVFVSNSLNEGLLF